MIRCLSVCSGIEAWSCAVEGMDGYSVSALSEIEPFPCAVLAERYPFVTNLGDMTKINGWAMRGQIDLLVGGTPCQGFSVAGLRGGLNDPRSGLAGHYVRLAAELRVPWLLWENVPGALSTSGGGDFRVFVSALDELGYGLAWAVLDAQWFGVPQRRKRLFLVGRLGDWRGPGAVLFEPGRVCGNPPARRSKREGNPSPAEGGTGEEIRGGHTGSVVCPTMTSSGAGFARVDGRAEHDCGTLVVQPNEVSATLCASGAGTDRPSAQGSHEGFCVVSMKTCNTKSNGGNISDKPVTYALAAEATPPAVLPLDLRHLYRNGEGFRGMGRPEEPAGSLTAEGKVPCIAPLSPPLYPRRLTPVECERLQGFPDGWTDVRFQGKPARDALRYRALGNSMAVPVMRWLAEGIREFF